ncbi:hypothetical protein CP975_01610 [Streptomyces alboniger]|uniref:Uncharacterized protein n=1 Tax=Streptomyces alboniger TaxID=132473 RepID=A0A5J6HH33_STRAD|nr:hypothetical protein CP975_01610 [Streptomyces alboniger]
MTRMRTEAPVTQVRMPYGTSTCRLVTRYADVRAARGSGASPQGWYTYGVVVHSVEKPSRSRIGRLSSEASTWR